MMERLFAIYIGGHVEGAHVELHDMRFAVGRTVEDCIEHLKAKWWGTPSTLHLDAWGALEWADGYSVSIRDTPQITDKKLWFLNLGGYDPGEFTELHKNVFVVAEDDRAARKRALALVEGWTSPHKDFLFEVETAVDVASALVPGRHVHLTEGPAARAFAFEARYVPIGRMK